MKDLQGRFEQFAAKEQRHRASSGWVLAGFLALFPGCGTGPSSDDAPVPDAQTAARGTPVQPRDARSLAAQRSAGAPARAAATLRRAGSDYEILVESPEGFPLRAHDPVLEIGDARFKRYRYPDPNNRFALVYTLSAQEFDALPDGASISVGNGVARRVAQSFGTLNKTNILKAPKGAVSP